MLDSRIKTTTPSRKIAPDNGPNDNNKDRNLNALIHFALALLQDTPLSSNIITENSSSVCLCESLPAGEAVVEVQHVLLPRGQLLALDHCGRHDVFHLMAVVRWPQGVGVLADWFTGM